jgi:hypothetical protein
MSDDDLDTPGYGAAFVAKVLNLRNKKTGELDDRQAYYVVERGYVDVDRIGRKIISTKRRLLKSVGVV